MSRPHALPGRLDKGRRPSLPVAPWKLVERPGTPWWPKLLVVTAMVLLLPPSWAQSRPPARPGDLVGTVVRVADGDSFTVELAAGGAPVAVRLQGIDAPEICQPWGHQAKAALEGMVLGRPVTIANKGRDDHGRMLAVVEVDGADVGERLVRDGHAWSYRYRHDKGPFVAEERMARALGRGLHAGGGAVMPRDFRRTHGPCVAESGAGPVAPAVAPMAPAAPVSRTAAPSAPPTAASTRRCDGRKHCSQMSSCEEATWFLRHCPGMEMDGDRDGIPCEQQWCTR
jgi:endonuclease YncB( thermonuclease family)